MQWIWSICLPLFSIEVCIAFPEILGYRRMGPKYSSTLLHIYGYVRGRRHPVLVQYFQSQHRSFFSFQREVDHQLLFRPWRKLMLKPQKPQHKRSCISVIFCAMQYLLIQKIRACMLHQWLIQPVADKPYHELSILL